MLRVIDEVKMNVGVESIRRMELAIQRTKELESKYKDKIQNCVNNTKLYDIDVDVLRCNTGHQCVFTFTHLSRVLKLNQKMFNPDSKYCIVNDGSYTKPGGGYINGYSGHEGELCRSSFLYNVLSKIRNYYEENKMNRNNGMYKNRALYSTDIVFSTAPNIEVTCDVLTVSPPNYNVALKYESFSAEENEEALDNRIKFILDVAEVNGVEHLIIGDFGFGYFKQDPRTVAGIFKKHLHSGCYTFREVIFCLDSVYNSDLYAEIFNS